jgi:4-hydroxybenzoate polyprenyltransferase
MATIRQVLYNSITVNLPKNIVQLLLGAVLFSVIFGTINLPGTLLAIVGLSLAYSSVYMYNDIIDREEDAKDPEKRAWKPIANGTLSTNGALSLYALLMMSGMLVSFFVNMVFGLMMVALLFFNFLHSSPWIHLKRKKIPTVLNITLIEFIKYSSGWFALTLDTARFPLMFVLMFSVIYTMGYVAYKFKFDGKTIKSNKAMFGGLGLVTVLLFIGSLVAYTFPLPMIVLFILSALIFGCRHMFWRSKKSFNQMIMLEIIILPLLIIAFLLLNIPEFGQLNQQIVDFFRNVLLPVIGL